MAKKKPTARNSGKSAAKSASKAKPAPLKKSSAAKASSKKVAAVKKAAAKKKTATKSTVKKAPARGAAKTASKKAAAPKKVVAKKPTAVKKLAAKPAKKVAAPPVKPARQTPPAERTKKVAPKVAEPRPGKVVPPAKPAPAPPAPKAAPKPAAAARPTAPPAKKRPMKERVVMEFYLNSSPHALYELLSTPSGFSEWYCQDVDVRGDQYTFLWDGEQEETTLIGRKLGEVIRFRRNDDEDPEAFFEFRVRIDAMTNDVCLVVTDHAWPNEVEETRNLWTSQIETLGRVLGA